MKLQVPVTEYECVGGPACGRRFPANLYLTVVPDCPPVLFVPGHRCSAASFLGALYRYRFRESLGSVGVFDYEGEEPLPL